MFTKICSAILLTLAAFNASAASIEILIGADDGFGGTQGSNVDPGDAYNPNDNTLTPIAPGTYTNLDGLDAPTEQPWEPYLFIFDFGFDTSGFSTMSNAIVEIQHGSLANRSGTFSGVGFGLAAVSANVGGTDTNLGLFLETDTGNRYRKPGQCT